MSSDQIVDVNPQPTLKLSSNDITSKRITLLNEQTQDILLNMTIPKVLVLYTGLEKSTETNSIISC